MIKKRDAEIGLAVKTTARVKWHGLDIPVGTPGVLQGVSPHQPAAMVKFDNGEKWGSFVCWLAELERDPSPTMTMRIPSGVNRNPMLNPKTCGHRTFHDYCADCRRKRRAGYRKEKGV